jgi:hypothetical protein
MEKNMKRFLPATVLVTTFSMVGCAQIPQAAIDVNRQVATGITALNDNAQELIRAWEETAYQVLDERWSKVYAQADAAYRTKRGVQPGVLLTSPQAEEVAGLATLVRDDVRKKIRTEADGMRKIVTANAKNTLDANESVTMLLINANAIGAAQHSALKQVGTLLPIADTVTNFINIALKSAGL